MIREILTFIFRFFRSEKGEPPPTISQLEKHREDRWRRKLEVFGTSPEKIERAYGLPRIIWIRTKK